MLSTSLIYFFLLFLVVPRSMSPSGRGKKSNSRRIATTPIPGKSDGIENSYTFNKSRSKNPSQK